MFRALINDAKAAATSVVAKYLARASVAVPFLIAAGFAIAAITHMLIQRFGAVLGCWLLAAGFTLIGVVATLLVKVKEHEEEVAEQQAEAADTADVANEAAAQALMQAPLALVGGLLSTPLGPKERCQWRQAHSAQPSVGRPARAHRIAVLADAAHRGGRRSRSGRGAAAGA